MGARHALVPFPRAIRAVAAALLSGCGGPEGKPTAPDLDALVEAYDRPTASLRADNAAAAWDALEATVLGSGGFCGWTDVASLACDPGAGCASCEGDDQAWSAAGSAGGGEAPAAFAARRAARVGDLTVEGEGWIRVTRICEGWGRKPAPDPEHGVVRLTMTFSDEGMDPVVWGGFDACRMAPGGARRRVDGDFAWWVGDSFRFEDAGDLDVITRIALDLTTDGAEQRVDFDFRVTSDPRLEFRVPLEGGHLVFYTSLDGMGYRADNGTFTCDFLESRCDDESGASVSW